MKLKKNNFYKTAMHIAVEDNDVEIVRLLLANEKININMIDEIFICNF